MSETDKVITEALVARKIALYCNIGTTIAPEPILSLLKVRSTAASDGTFMTPEEASAQDRAGEGSPASEQEDDGSPEVSTERVTEQNGMVRGVTGKRMRVNGMLDLRGVPPAEVATIESLEVNGLFLTDEGNSGALAGVHPAINGTTLVVPPDLRVIVQSDTELSKAALEAMPPAQKLMLVGHLYVRPDVPAALMAEKFARLVIVGSVIMTEAVQGAILGMGEVTGPSIILPDTVTHVVRSVGDTTWTAGYLSRLPDGIAYVNIGNTVIPAQ